MILELFLPRNRFVSLHLWNSRCPTPRGPPFRPSLKQVPQESSNVSPGQVVPVDAEEQLPVDLHAGDERELSLLAFTLISGLDPFGAHVHLTLGWL